MTPAGAANGAAAPPLLAITDLFVNYGGIQALQDMSLEVRAGEVVTVVGCGQFSSGGMFVHGPSLHMVPAAQLDAHVDKLTAAMLKAPRISLTSAKEYIRTGPDMPVAGAVEYARNLHATINSAAEIRKPRT